MFDIGFFELLVIAIVGLVVVGPERLPEAARAVGLWIGRLKRSLRDTRGELERQLGADDIRRQLHNEEVMRSLEATRQQVQDAIGEDTPAKPRRQYREEPELPDHAHTESAHTESADTRQGDNADSATNNNAATTGAQGEPTPPESTTRPSQSDDPGTSSS